MTEEQRIRIGKPDSDDRQSLTPADEADTTLLCEEATPGAAESPMAVEDYGVTAAEESHREPLSQRLRRELPDIPAGHRPADPDRVAAAGFAGRLVTTDRAYDVDDDRGYDADTEAADVSFEEAEADEFDVPPEEAAMHLAPWPREPLEPLPSHAPQRRTHADRLEVLEAQMAVLLTMAQVHTETLRILTEALERPPTEEPGDGAHKVNASAHEAHALLTTLRDVPR